MGTTGYVGRMWLLLACAPAQPTADVDTAVDSAAETAETPTWGYDERPINATCVAHERPTSDASVQLTRVFSDFSVSVPLAMLAVGDDFWIVNKFGYVLSVHPEGGRTLVADFTDRVFATGFELGLLGMALHPDFPNTPYIFANYNAGTDSDITSRVSRFSATADAIDMASEEILLEIEQPENNHNGGHLLFGPDGYLYIGFGDGGGSGDPYESGQSLDTLLGKMLRIDVSGDAGYSVPADNPFVGVFGVRPEIWAYGLRNPWRYSFDNAGTLWVADVGQSAWEEIDHVERGGNYGWNLMEGMHCYDADECDTAGLISPVVEYAHDGSASIVGGAVYTGDAIAGLRGAYIYADTFTGKLARVDVDDSGAYQSTTLIEDMGIRPTSFGVGPDGELYLLDYVDGGIWRIDPAETGEAILYPATLSASGCADTESLIAYDVISPLWSDGAEKRRWLGLPDGSAIAVNDDGEWDLPIGSVVRKDFVLGGQTVETRLLERHSDGDWAGYTFVWDGDDATLVESAETVETATGPWTVPAGQCSQCHSGAAGRVLGIETEQLAREVTYPNGNTADQLDQLVRIGVIAARPTAPPALEANARAYLYANCSQCHQPGALAPGDLDFRWDTPLSNMGVCDVPPSAGDLDLDDPRIVAPGDPGRSVLSARMHAENWARMPPLGTDLVDGEGTALVDAWIASLTGCD